MGQKDLVLSPEMQVLVAELKEIAREIHSISELLKRSEERELVRQAAREAARQPKPCKYCGQPIKWAMKDNPAPGEFPRKPVNVDGTDHICDKTKFLKSSRGEAEANLTGHLTQPMADGMKACNRCGEPIKFTKKEGRWMPLNADGSPHYCQEREGF